jgi:hypothetical protein
VILFLYLTYVSRLRFIENFIISFLDYDLHNLLRRPVVIVLAKPPEFRALDARLVAWLNLSHLEKAIVLVVVSTRAIAIRLLAVYSSNHLTQNSPTSVNHNGVSAMKLINLMMATIPITTHRAGCAYRAIQKNRLSVALICRTSGSADSNTQCDSPV